MDDSQESKMNWQPGIALRRANAGDASSVAAIHADSWRRHYRGAFRDAYLDGDIVAERTAFWSERLATRKPNAFTIAAENQNSIVGFAHVIVDHDAQWGSLLDNLHVTFHLKRHGIGRKIMQALANVLADSDRRKFYLWVLEQNTAAQGFYRALGGVHIETCLRGPFPGGGFALGQRMAWASIDC